VDEQWDSQLQKFYRQRFFTHSPYGLMPGGSKDVVGRATVAQIRDYRAGVLKGGNCVLAIYGSFDGPSTRARLEKLFGEVPAGKTDLKIPPARQVGKEGEAYVLKTQNQVAGVIVAVPGMKIENLADRMPIDVLTTIISGWQLPSGWLHTELRGRQLVYVVHAYNWAGLAPGAFVAYAACQPENAQTVLDVIRKDFTRASVYTPTQKEIDEAVNTILTAEILDKQTMSDLAMSAALDELYGFGYDFRTKLERLYRAVTPEDVARVGKKYLASPTVTAVSTPRPETLSLPGAKISEPADQPVGPRATK
jgi:predicted Zn-dependent peptidase